MDLLGPYHWWAGQGNRWARQPEFQSGARRMGAQVGVIQCLAAKRMARCDLFRYICSEFQWYFATGGFFFGGGGRPGYYSRDQQFWFWFWDRHLSLILLHPQAWVVYASRWTSSKDSKRSRPAHRTSQTCHPLPAVYFFVRPSSHITWGG